MFPMLLLAWLTFLHGSNLIENKIHDAAKISYKKSGDFILGGIFSSNLRGISSCDSVPWLTNLQLIQAMVYAVDIVNSRDDLLLNVTLGFDIHDDCFNEDLALWAAMSLIDKDQCDQTTSGDLIGIIGPVTSTQSILVSAVCDLVEIPIISYGASSDELSDKSRFKFFSRAVPPDSHQSEALADLLKYFNWEYVSLVYFANTYGIQASHTFQKFARERGICIATSVPLQRVSSKQDLLNLADTLYRSRKARVVVMFVASSTANDVIAILRDHYPDFAAEITWVGSDFWGYTLSPSTDDILPMGGIFTTFFLPVPLDFKRYFTELSWNKTKQNPWMEMYFRYNNITSSLGQYVSDGLGGLAAAVIDSVFAFANALDSLLKEISICYYENCHSEINITGEEFLSFIRNTSFVGTRGLFKFDANGDLNGKYVLKNLQMVNGEPTLVDIAVWDALNTSQKLTIYPELIQWLNGTRSVPTSTCREQCQSGYAIMPLEAKCCSGCTRCENNEIIVNRTECQSCKFTEWPNENFTECKQIVPTSLDIRHPVLITILLFNSFGVILCLLTIIGFIIYFNHPQVKASSRELSAINICGLLMGCLAVFLLLFEQTESTCALVNATISLCLTLIYAPTLLKVSRIYRIFDAGKRSTRRPRGIGPREQLLFVAILVTIQLIIVIIGTLTDPSKPEILVPTRLNGYLEIYCHYGYGFVTSLFYSLILVIGCCYYAFQARKVPDNFNESKFIAGSVYSTLIFSLAAFPLYTTAVNVVQKVAAISMAILINLYITLACVYLHKLYVIKFLKEEERSTDDTHLSMNRRPDTFNRNRVYPTGKRRNEKETS